MLLTVREAALLLKASERQVYRWVDAGEIPSRAVRGQVRFNRTDLLEWATGRGLPVSVSAFDAAWDLDDRAPSFDQALRSGGVHDVPAVDRESALRAVVECAPLPASLERGFVLDVLLARQHGFALSPPATDGIAIPLARRPLVAPGAAAAVSVSHFREPVVLAANGHELVRTLFLIVSPTVRAHLQLMTHLSRALLDSSFRDAARRHAPTEELAALAGRLEGGPSVPPAVSRDRVSPERVAGAGATTERT